MINTGVLSLYINDWIRYGRPGVSVSFFSLCPLRSLRPYWPLVTCNVTCRCSGREADALKIHILTPIVQSHLENVDRRILDNRRRQTVLYTDNSLAEESLSQLKPTSLGLYFEIVTTQIISTTIIQLEEVLNIYLVSSLQYMICPDQIASRVVFSPETMYVTVPSVSDLVRYYDRRGRNKCRHSAGAGWVQFTMGATSLGVVIRRMLYTTVLQSAPITRIP